MGRRWHGPPLQEALRGRGARLDDFNQMRVGSALALHVRGRDAGHIARGVVGAPASSRGQHVASALKRLRDTVSAMRSAQPKKDVHGSKMTRQEQAGAVTKVSQSR